MSRTTLRAAAALLAIAGLAGADGVSAQDSFQKMQERGRQAMGVDQYTSAHVFEALPDGGRIELQRDASDAAGVAQIRTHLLEITKAFGTGDFSTPAFVHMQNVPGSAVMTAKRAAIKYVYRELPGGAEVRITTKDAQALQAIHEFLAFQRQEHRTEHGAGHADRQHAAVQHAAGHQGATMQHGAAHHGAGHQGAAQHAAGHHGAHPNTSHEGTHKFEALTDGGRVEMQNTSDDAAAIKDMRDHLQALLLVFSAGDANAALDHMKAMPGVSAMIAKRATITYTYRELPRGGEVRITTKDAQALQAIHEFLAFHKRNDGGQ